MKAAHPEQILVHDTSANAAKQVPWLVNKVDLIVTSPPYHNAINYVSHAADSAKNYRQQDGNAGNYAADYLPAMNEVWTACYQMLRPGGHLVINAGTVLADEKHYPLPQDLLSEAMRNDPWEYIKTIIWFKVTAGVKRAGSVIQHPLPDYWSYNIMTEHIQILRKPGGRTTLNRDVPIEWLQTVWNIAPVPPRQIDHPAPYPEDLPHRFIRMLTNKNDWVMDPFVGAGATTKTAYDLGRRSIGFDISKKYVDVARARNVKASMVRQLQLDIKPVPETKFVPGKTRGKTRHGAGQQTRRAKS